MKKIIRITENDLIRIFKRVINEERYGSFGNMRRKDFKGDQFVKDDDKFVDDEEIYAIGSDDDFDTEEFYDYESYRSKYPEDNEDSPRWFGKGESGKKMFDTYRKTTEKPFKVKNRRN